MATRAAAEQGLALTGVTADAAAAVTELARRGERFDAVIVNPPRRGVAVEVRRLVAELAPDRLVYVSCAPETLARDAAHLATLGYELERATPFDMIPLSDAVETLAVFRPATARPPLVLAESAAFIVVNKEPYVALAGAAGERGALAERVRRLPTAEHSSAVDELPRDASGGAVFARHDTDRDAVKRALAAARVEVLALVRGVIRLSGKLPNERELGAAAHYERVAVHGGHSLVRVYAPAAAFDAAARAFARFGHPLLGDAKFGDRRANVHLGLRHGLDRAFWHRAELVLAWEDADVRARARLAPDLERVLASLGAR
jgi:23S rRNA (uracil1939-C5)-methyltransferase